MSVPAVDALAAVLGPLGWVRGLWIGGSLATGDHVPDVSDLDLVALVDGHVDVPRREVLADLHSVLDHGAAAGADLGCAYVDAGLAHDVDARHPTWTHGRLVQRILSGISRAELVLHGSSVFGPAPREVLPPVGRDDVRRAAYAEITGYWAMAARRPWWWLDPVLADLGLTSMARGRHALASGDLLTKTAAVEVAHAPTWLVADLRARRTGAEVTSPRIPTALIAWRDARRTTAEARRRPPVGAPRA